MNALSTINAPHNPGPFKRAEDRWRPYLDNPESASAFAGPVLTHSDWTPDNVLIAPGRAWLIDWAWPTLAAAWTDPACWILRLMASGGHTAPQAERQANRLPAYQAADPAHIDLFAAANARLWNEITRSSTSTWTKDMAQAARTWLAYRQTRLQPAEQAHTQPETLNAGSAAQAIPVGALPSRTGRCTHRAGRH
jgi:thiamine kinase-like enzyme